MANRIKLTPKKKELFCETLVKTGGNVSAACDALNLAPVTAYDHRKKDEAFAAAWDQAVERGTENLEQEAYRRAFEGTDEPHFYQDRVAGYVRRYSDVLLIFLLKARKRNLYDPPQRQEVSGPDGGPVQFVLPPRSNDNGNGSNSAD